MPLFSRKPAPHTASHAANGSDPITPSSIGAATEVQGVRANTSLQDQFVISGSAMEELHGTYTRSLSLDNTYTRDNSDWVIELTAGGDPLRSWWRIRNVTTSAVAYVSSVFFSPLSRTPEQVSWGNDNLTVVGAGAAPFPVVDRNHGHRVFASGRAGFVPAPATGDDAKFLKGDGTWDTLSGGGSDNGFSIAMALAL